MTVHQGSDESFFYIKLTQGVNGDLNKTEKERWSRIEKDSNYKGMIVAYNSYKGQLHEKLQKHILNENQLLDLYYKMQPKEIAKAIEESNIREIKQREYTRRVIRSFFILACGMLSVLFLYEKFSPKRETAFTSLDALAYEAMAMAKDPNLARLSLPTNTLEDVFVFAKNIPTKTFNPYVPRVDFNWLLQGASVIDYDLTSIFVVQYIKNKSAENLIFFSFYGHIDNFIKSEKYEMNGFFYHTYSSDKVNLVAWQIDSTTVGVLAGWESIEALAKIASLK